MVRVYSQNIPPIYGRLLAGRSEVGCPRCRFRTSVVHVFDLDSSGVLPAGPENCILLLALINDLSGDHRGHRRATKLTAIEWGVAGAAGGFGGEILPAMLERKN